MCVGSPCVTLVCPGLLQVGKLDGGAGTEALLDAIASLWFGHLVTAATWADEWLCSALSR